MFTIEGNGSLAKGLFSKEILNKLLIKKLSKFFDWSSCRSFDKLAGISWQYIDISKKKNITPFIVKIACFVSRYVSHYRKV